MWKCHSFLGAAMGCCWLLIGVSVGWSQGTELLMVTLEHPPHSFEADGMVTGASTEMIERILTQMGYKPIFQYSIRPDYSKLGSNGAYFLDKDAE